MNTISGVFLSSGLLLAIAMGPGACGLSKPYPPKQLYAIDVGAPTPVAALTSGTTLRVLPVSVSDPFSSREFQYQIAPNQFQQDYYANFVTDPDRLLTADLIAWMSASGLYANVVDASSSVKTDQALQCVVSQLYGDMSDAAVSPRAVVQARFFLLDESDVEAKVLFNREYRQAEPVSGNGTDKLTQAWGRAMRKILEQVTTDLRAAQTAGTPK